ncbi:hypothetical protein [Chitinophaga qingshengii]|uniref:DUF1963 domain-containing protein n=1 Tax=Chitinophaga qingshengii TaxID=1569794 RepID=A0ABR7TUT0_9BACT|nr:hypothetical protein [Chitinophaga qingshengii]MBC9934246.1 hypothetical protein [Chitinophaga qingshengii]
MRLFFFFWGDMYLARMLTLDAKAWQHLSGPFGIDGSLPEAIAGLQSDYSKELLDEIIWEKIYHQDTLYENTFATIPYLLELAANNTDPETQIDILCSLAILLAADGNPPAKDTIPAEFRDNSGLSPEEIKAVFNDYLLALERLPALCETLLPEARELPEETDKSYFLAALAVAHGQRDFARVFIQYYEGEEYMAYCPACEAGSHVWPKGDELRIYAEDPVFHKEQEGDAVTPHPELIPAWDGSTITAANRYAWGYDFLTQLDMPALRARWPYLFGTARCPGCGAEMDLFRSILAGV